MAQKNKHVLNIFEVLKNIDLKNAKFFQTLTDREQKAFQPLVVMKWLACTKDDKQVYFLNELVNTYVYDLHKHKELLYYLLTICTSNKQKYYKWNQKNKPNTHAKTVVELIKEYYGYSTKEASLYVDIFCREDLLQMAQELGWQKNQLQQLKREMKQ